MPVKIKKFITGLALTLSLFFCLTVQAGDIVVTVTMEHLVSALVEAPSDKTAEPLETVIYNFTVHNLSNVADSYDLSVFSSQGWGPVITTGSTVGPLMPSESAGVIVEQAVPIDAPVNTRDILTLTAVSKTDINISGSDSVATTVIIEAGEVEVKVTPNSQKGEPGETVYLQVTVKNKGNLNDSFKLAGFTLSGWQVSFPDGDTTGIIKPGESESVRIGAAIPMDAMPKTKDTLTVNAASRTNPSVSASDTAAINVEKQKKEKNK